MNRAVLSLCVLALCACRHGDDEKTFELPLPKVTVHVIDPGAEPRAPLRLHGSGHPAVVYKSTAQVTTEKGFTNTITRSIESTRERDADGVYHEHLRDLDRGGTIDSWFDAREVYTRATVKTGTVAWKDVTLLEVFPDEDLGVGARWHEDIAIGKASASADVELLAKDGDRVRERITYHGDDTTPKNGWAAHHDGTATLELDLGGIDPSMHMEETYVMDKSNGKVAKGSMILDIVKQ